MSELPPIFDPASTPSVSEIEQATTTEAAGVQHRPLTVDEVLEEVGRHGGPSEFGWHSQESCHFCARKARYDARAAQLDYPRDTSPALSVGSVFHEFLAERYTAKKEGRSYADVAEKVERTVARLREEGHEDAANESRRLYYGYAAKYDAVDEFVDRHKIVAVEKLYYRELPWGVRYSGRADLVLEARDGVIIVDHKTTRARDAEFNEGWVLDPAQIGLQWLVEREYKHVSGYVINGIVKTVRLDTRLDFPRMFFASQKRLIREWLDMMRYRHVEQQNAQLAGYPPNFASCLVRRGEGFRRCRWFNACALGLRPTAELALSL